MNKDHILDYKRNLYKFERKPFPCFGTRPLTGLKLPNEARQARGEPQGAVAAYSAEIITVYYYTSGTWT